MPVTLLREHVKCITMHVKLLRAHVEDMCAREVIIWARERYYVFKFYFHHVPLGAP